MSEVGNLYTPTGALRDWMTIGSGRRPVSARAIIEMVSRDTQVKENELRSPRRTAKVCKARWLAMYLLREHTIFSLLRIGKLLHRDHTTIMYGLEKFEALMEQDEKLKATVTRLSARIVAGTEL